MIITHLSYEEALALPEPKEIRLNGSQVVVYTGEDMQPAIRVVSAYDFRQRFTDEEMDTILQSSASDPNVQKLLLKLYTASDIDLGSVTVTFGVQYLIDQGLIAPQRKTEILA